MIISSYFYNFMIFSLTLSYSYYSFKLLLKSLLLYFPIVILIDIILF